ncbi:AAA family ATPase [Winogradskyella aurantiaca]|uniref:AAA family ATPase n=1 Tax=Winogradskyella aurantiaca TaxID=2219558 RepID=UPI000E1D3019|nr:ATP-binding protein [Winogradskyella aurantiaca]
MTKRVVITGGPSTGKTTLINSLKEKGFLCFDEISRQVTLEARQEGIEQLFLKDPLLFSKKLLEGRTEQFLRSYSIDESVVFYDRGIPDVLAYMDYIGDTYPQEFIDQCQNHRYDSVIILNPWKRIYSRDGERYETFEQALQIHRHLVDTYKHYGYALTELPEDSVNNRIQILLDSLNL